MANTFEPPSAQTQEKRWTQQQSGTKSVEKKKKGSPQNLKSKGVQEITETKKKKKKKGEYKTGSSQKQKKRGASRKYEGWELTATNRKNEKKKWGEIKNKEGSSEK